MDSTLQKRLIGAAVLIVLAIIFVPMLLDGSDRAGSETLPLVIPGMPERDFETREIAIDPVQPTGVAEAIGVATPPQLDTAVAPAAAADPDALATIDTQAPTRVDAVSGETVQAPAVADSVAASGRFLLALGSYSNTANAQALATQLRAAGYKVLSDQVAVNGQNATRLRVGPYASRGQAEAARLAIKNMRADLAPSISEVDDTPAADAPPAARSTATASVWAVQVGAYKLEPEAFVEKINAEAGVLFRVRIGPENKRADADAVKAGLKTRFGIDGIVVPYP